MTPAQIETGGTGRVVLTTVNHLNNDVYDLVVQNSKGQEAALSPTGLHRLYRASDSEWVAVQDLELGDEIYTLGEPVVVTRLQAVQGVQRVFNMTVESEHVYHVSAEGLLAHNNYGNAPKGTDDYVTLYRASRRGHGASDIADGYNPSHYPRNGPYEDGSAYFARDRSIAEEYVGRAGYEDYITEIRIPREKYDRLFRQFEAPYLSSIPGRTEARIPREFLEALNIFSERVAP